MNSFKPSNNTAVFLGLSLLLVSLSRAEAAEAQSLANVKLPEGFQAAVYATPDQLSNPVAICFDSQGRLYTAEAHRRVTGAWGVTMSRWWSMEDYGGKTLADRQAMYDRWAHIVPPAKLTRHSDIVRQLVDEDGDGKVDVSRVFADGFNQPLEGNAAGLIAHDGDILLANAPTLWRLRDSNRDGAVDVREKLAEGIGVRVGVYGHDLHGLTWGPDGRLYFTIGDRGFHVKTKEGRTLSAPTRGAAFRCFPDGSGLEVFHIGLRNPQELAFNEVGDLFTVDNDMGGVDKCRILHIVEGGDSGWDASYQLTRNFREETQRHDHTEPPWFTENLWELPHEGQPLWVNPPLAHLTSGPSGLVHYPGVGLPEEFADNFFICDFRGSSARSGVHRFKLDQAGAGYRVAETNQFVWNICPADIEFGYDGEIYLADWINGWGGDGARQIVRMFHPERCNDAHAIPGLFREGFSHRSRKDLLALLKHADRRVRLAAQFELAAQGRKNLGVLLNTARKAESQHARLHAIWAIWQIGLKVTLPKEIVPRIATLFRNSDSETRAQAARILGEVGDHRVIPDLVKALLSNEPRVQYHAAISLGKLRATSAVDSMAAMLQRNADLDPLLRHAGAYAFSRMKEGHVLRFSQSPSRAVRLAVLLGLRMNASVAINLSLKDPDPKLRFEAIRAIHDLPIAPLWQPLADLIDSEIMTDASVPFPIQHRILNANFRLGSYENATRMAAAAVNPGFSGDIRLEAMRALEKWNEPSPFDRVTWHHRPITKPRPNNLAEAVAQTLQTGFDSALEDARKDPDKKRGKARLQSLTRLLIKHDVLPPERLASLASTPDLDAEVRLEIFESLNASAEATKLIPVLLKDPSPSLQLAAAASLTSDDPRTARTALAKHLAGKNMKNRQLAIRRLGKLDHSIAAELLAPLLNRDLAGPEPDALDLIEAGAKSTSAELQRLAKSAAARIAESAPHGEFQPALNGGDAKNGRRLFETHAIQCVRCHQIKGFGGDAGPELTKIARELDRNGLLTALLDPPARIAPGFGSLELELKDGDIVSGFIAEETDAHITLTTLAGESITTAKSDIATRSKPVSAMPTMKGVLTLSEMRDLVEYLASLK